MNSNAATVSVFSPNGCAMGSLSVKITVMNPIALQASVVSPPHFLLIAIHFALVYRYSSDSFNNNYTPWD
jgi:hypothetical protein